jgi:hypothetical protein
MRPRRGCVPAWRLTVAPLDEKDVSLRQLRHLRRNEPRRAPRHCHGPRSSREPFTARVTASEEAGEYCFPPIAACITGAARLMLALLEPTISDAGGTWMFCDTDSMAIVATEDGGDLIHLPAGVRSCPTVHRRSYAQVNEIRQRFNALNPCNGNAVADILNFEYTGFNATPSTPAIRTATSRSLSGASATSAPTWTPSAPTRSGTTTRATASGLMRFGNGSSKPTTMAQHLRP